MPGLVRVAWADSFDFTAAVQQLLIQGARPSVVSLALLELAEAVQGNDQPHLGPILPVKVNGSLVDRSSRRHIALSEGDMGEVL